VLVGFRPGRGAHDAIRALNRAVYQGKVSWIVEADIESFFDSLDRTKLQEMLQIRVADGSLRRLVGKCLRVGVLDGEERTEPERGPRRGRDSRRCSGTCICITHWTCGSSAR